MTSTRQDHGSASARRLVAACVVTLLLLAFVDGALPYAQMLVLHGAAPVPHGAVKVLLALCLLFAVATSGVDTRGDSALRALLVAATAFAAYMLLHSLVLTPMPAGYALRGLNAYYALLLLLPLALVSRIRLTDSTLIRGVAWTLPVLLALGFAQVLLHAPLLPVEDMTGAFRTNAWKFYGQVRAFSLFSSPQQFGSYLLFAALLLLASAAAQPRRRAVLLNVLAAAALAGMLLTRTRAVWLHALCAFAAFVLLPRLAARRRGLLHAAPVLFGLLAAAGIAVALASGAGATQGGESLAQRADAWWYALSHWFGGDWRAILFGTGFFQHAQANSSADLEIDNIFIAAGVHGGVVGVALLLALMTLLWTTLERRSAQGCGPVARAAAAFWMPWMAVASLNTALPLFMLVALLALLAGDRTPRAADAEAGRTATRIATVALSWGGALTVAVLLSVTALVGPASRNGERRWETRARLKMLQRIERAHMAATGRWCNGVDSLLSFARTAQVDRRTPVLPLSTAVPPPAALRTPPGDARPYVVLATPDGTRYQLRDPDGREYISSWTVPDEFDRASWE